MHKIHGKNGVLIFFYWQAPQQILGLILARTLACQETGSGSVTQSEARLIVLANVASLKLIPGNFLRIIGEGKATVKGTIDPTSVC